MSNRSERLEWAPRSRQMVARHLRDLLDCRDQCKSDRPFDNWNKARISMCSRTRETERLSRRVKTLRRSVMDRRTFFFILRQYAHEVLRGPARREGVLTAMWWKEQAAAGDEEISTMSWKGWLRSAVKDTYGGDEEQRCRPVRATSIAVSDVAAW